jgi:hypothetical protein
MPLRPPFTPSGPVATESLVGRGVKGSAKVATIDSPPPVARIHIVYESPVFYRLPTAEERKGLGNKPRPPEPQWGIKGTLSLDTDFFGAAARTAVGGLDDLLGFPEGQVRKEYRMVTVWERWKAGKWTGGMFTVNPGTYAGYVKIMANKKDENPPFPSIWVIWEWDEESSSWKQNVPTAKWWSGKKPKDGSVERRRVDGVFIHPGPWPSWFLGCIGPGTEEADWGVIDLNNSRAAMWDILETVGVDASLKRNKAAWVKRYLYPSQKDAKWFLIEVAGTESFLKEVEGLRTQRV